MHNQSQDHRRSASIDVRRQRNPAGPIILAPITDHRIVVHASRETLSVCRSTGDSHLRIWGDIDIVPFGEEGGYDAAAPCEALEIRLDPAVLERVAAEMGRDGTDAQLTVRHMAKNARIGHLAQALQSEQEDRFPGDSLFVDSIAAALAVQLLGLGSTPDAKKRGLSASQLKRLFDFVETHLEQPLSIDILAQEAGASSSHLRHSFREITGQTIHRYVMRRRVEKARSLLLWKDWSVSEIALATGFAHQSHLARWMRRELGYTPRDLKRDSSLA